MFLVLLLLAFVAIVGVCVFLVFGRLGLPDAETDIAVDDTPTR